MPEVLKKPFHAIMTLSYCDNGNQKWLDDMHSKTNHLTGHQRRIWRNGGMIRVDIYPPNYDVKIPDRCPPVAVVEIID